MKPSPRHSKCGRSSNTSAEHRSARGLPSSRTTRVYWFSTSHRPSRICVEQHGDGLQDVERLEPGGHERLAVLLGHEPVRAGCRPPSTRGPGPRKPSRRRSGDSRIALIGGTIVTWLQNTRKFVTPSARGLQQGERGRRRGRLEPDGEEHDLAVGVARRRCAARRAASRRSARRRPAPWPRAGCPLLPGTRIMSPNEVKMTPGSRPPRWRRRPGPSGSRTPGSPGRAPARPFAGSTCSMPCR